MKLVYKRSENRDELVNILSTVVPGNKFRWIGEKKRYTCIARSEHFIIVAKPFTLMKDSDGKPLAQYSILDLTQMKCNRDNLVFGLFNYLDKDDCEEALVMLERSLVPWEERFHKGEEDENGNIKLIPNYPDADSTLEISSRGIADIARVVEEIYQ